MGYTPFKAPPIYVVNGIADIALLRKAHWHRRRGNRRKARELESMAFDGTNGPIDGSVYVGTGRPIERMSDALWMAGHGAWIIVLPAY